LKIILHFLFITYVFGTQILVATSSNLKYVMPSIIKKFNTKYPNIHIKIVVSSSGKLTSQILRGAPYDIFLSADMKYPLFLYSHGIGIFKPQVYAIGRIGFFSLKYSNFSNLSKFSSIAISKSKTTPYGRAAVEFLKNKGIYTFVKKKLVFAETVSSVIYYVLNGVDVGIISKSLIYSKKLENLGKFYYKDIDEKFYTPIKQGVLLIGKKKEALRFYKFLLSSQCKKIFKEYGYE